MTPWIFGQSLMDLLRVARLHDQQSVVHAVDRSTEDDESFRHKVVHEFGVRRPLFLLFDRPRVIPTRAVRSGDEKEFAHPCKDTTSGRSRTDPHGSRAGVHCGIQKSLECFGRSAAKVDLGPQSFFSNHRITHVMNHAKKRFACAALL